MKRLIILSIVLVTIGTSSMSLGWTSVGDGIDYEEFTASGPNKLFVTRMTRSNTNAFIDTSIGQGTLSGGLETVRNQATRYNDALSWWGQTWGATNEVIAAVNGGYYFLTSPYLIDGGQSHSGWHSHWFKDRGAYSGFAWKTDRTAFHGECVDYQDNKVYTKFMADGSNIVIKGINRAPGNSELILFTPQYNTQTPSGERTEVLVEMSKPNITTSGSGYASGTIRWKGTNTGSTWIPFDHLVLSAAGSVGTNLNNKSQVGAEVRIFQELVETNEPNVQGQNGCQDLTGVNWANVFAAINTNYHFLKNNVVRVPDADAHPGYIGYVNLNPRTAICWNSSYIFYVVCDGRSQQSVGMSCATLGTWAKNTLGATDGVNLDGGGSSTMVVNGTVKNVPSDGSERSVCNGIMMINVQPMQKTTTFTSGQNVSTTSSANMRLGPGTNYGIRTTLGSGASGTIVAHNVNGVYAKGYNWWKCNFGGTVGWVAESLLQLPPTAPSITQHPSNTSVEPGGTAYFTVAATGSTPLYYQWQKNSVNLSNGGHYSGVTTSTLTISNADTNDAANYRCVVTNAYGSATSNNASLTIATCGTASLTNGDFESDAYGNPPTGWTTYIQSSKSGSWTIQTASPPQGTQFQQTQVYNVDSFGGVYQNVTSVVSGAVYTISGSFRSNSVSATASVRYNLSGNVNRTNSTVLASTASTEWTTFSGTITASGASFILFLDHLNGGSTNKASGFDQVSIMTVSCPGGDPPSITQQPSAQNVCPGSNAVFTVAATGETPLSYQWQKNSVNLSNGGHYSGVTTTTLTVSSADTNDAANYRCVVTNSIGSATSNQAALTLKAATAITGHPSNQTVPEGGTAYFSVTATGDGTLSYQWRKNGTNIVNGGHYSGATTATLTVSNADVYDEAYYDCAVTAGCGSAISNEATLTIAFCDDPGVVNGDFEYSTAGNPPYGWTTYIQSSRSGSWTIQTASPPQGTQWQQTQVYNASSWGGVRQTITGLTPDSVYTISGTYRTNSVSATASVRYNLAGNTDRANSTALVSTTSTTWITFSENVTASGTSLSLFLDHLNGTSTNKAAAFDNINVTCAP